MEAKIQLFNHWRIPPQNCQTTLEASSPWSLFVAHQSLPRSDFEVVESLDVENIPTSKKWAAQITAQGFNNEPQHDVHVWFDHGCLLLAMNQVIKALWRPRPHLRRHIMSYSPNISLIKDLQYWNILRINLSNIWLNVSLNDKTSNPDNPNKLA